MHAPLVLEACTSLGSSGPGTRAVRLANHNDPRIKVIDVTDAIARRQIETRRQPTLAYSLGDAPIVGAVVQPGDVLDISIWEAPPAALFGTTVGIGTLGTTGLAAGAGISRASELPQQMVDRDGLIVMPFVGPLKVSGLSPLEISNLIVSRLRGRAHSPQVIVRIAENQTANVTVVGDVASSRRVPLTTKGERLLDALASAGGVRQPVEKMAIQVTRGDRVAREPLSQVIREPKDNIRLAANDVVTALYQPYSFQALGAVAKNEDVNFEGAGLTLAQGLARVGGLQDNRSNVKGIFIFRLEDPKTLPAEIAQDMQKMPDGRVAVIYRIDMGNPSALFIAQSFPIVDKDILYVSNAPLVDIQKFVNMASQIAFSIVGVASYIK